MVARMARNTLRTFAFVSGLLILFAGPVLGADLPRIAPLQPPRPAVARNGTTAQTIRVPATAGSAWDRPVLSNPATITISHANHNLVLNQRRDYILQCSPGPVRLKWALVVWGGHNVVFDNCHLDIAVRNWAAQFKNQTGTLWLHDVHFGGARLTGGIQLQEPHATVVMRDLLFDTVFGSYGTNHAELVQTWAGPKRLMIDGLTGSDTYQGLFLLPNQWYAGSPPTLVDLRHVNIDNSRGGYALWVGDVNGSIATWHVQDVYVLPNRSKPWRGWWLWPKPSTGDPSWNNVIAGRPPGGSYVRATYRGAAGVDQSISPSCLRSEQH
jgi:hypothetical protein